MLNQIREAYIEAIELRCLEAAKKGSNYIETGVLSEETIKELELLGYRIGYNYKGVNYGGDTSELIGNYIIFA